MKLKDFLKTLDVEKMESKTIVWNGLGLGSHIVRLNGSRGIDIINNKDNHEIKNITFDENLMVIEVKR